MKVKKKFLQKALLLLTSILFVFLYSSLIFNNHGVTDARNYYSFFQLIEDAGLIKFVSESYIASGKLEFVLYFFYLLISKFIEPNDFYLFTLANYTLILSITLYAFYTYSRHFFNSKYLTVTLYSLLVSFSWFPSYLNMLWLWRTDLAYAILLCSFFFYITGRYLRFFILLIIAIFTHYSSIPIIIVLLCIYHFIKNIHSISLGIKKTIVLFIAILGATLYKTVKKGFTSGDGVWESNFYLGNFILIYFFVGFILVYLTLNRIDKNRQKPAFDFFATSMYFSLFSFVIAISSNGNHQDITRVMHFSFLLYTFLLPAMFLYASRIQKYLILIYSLSGCIATIYLWFNLLTSI